MTSELLIWTYSVIHTMICVNLLSANAQVIDFVFLSSWGSYFSVSPMEDCSNPEYFSSAQLSALRAFSSAIWFPDGSPCVSILLCMKNTENSHFCSIIFCSIIPSLWYIKGINIFYELFSALISCMSFLYLSVLQSPTGSQLNYLTLFFLSICFKMCLSSFKQAYSIIKRRCQESPNNSDIHKNMNTQILGCIFIE